MIKRTWLVLSLAWVAFATGAAFFDGASLSWGAAVVALGPLLLLVIIPPVARYVVWGSLRRRY